MAISSIARQGGRLAVVGGIAAAMLAWSAAPAAAANSGTFTNSSTVTITDASSATPYPSNIAVSGLSGNVSDVNVTLTALTHPAPQDLDVLLVGPGGQTAVLMSDAGGTHALTAWDVTLDDEAPNHFTAGGNLMPHHVFTPGNFDGGDTDTWPSPAPAGPYGSALSNFDGHAANGTWSLYIVDDHAGSAGSITGWRLTITTTPSNTAPTAVNDTFSTNEDTPLNASVATNDPADPDGDTRTWIKVTDPAHGGVTFNPDGTFTYTPTANYNGSDSFTYKVNDGTADSNTATVSITVSPVNDAPIAVNDTFSTNEDTPLNASVATNDPADPDGDTRTWIKVTDPAHGGVTFNADGTFTYTPTANYNGPDSFTYKVNDGTADSNVATVSITVNAVNDPPVGTPDTYEATEGTPLVVAAPGVLANDTDVDGDPLTAVLASGPAHGTLVLDADGSFTYTPDAMFHGTDSFTYQPSDGVVVVTARTAAHASALGSAVTVTLTVAAVNHPPVANDDTASTTGSAVTVGVLANDTDADGDTLTASLASAPSHGTATCTATDCTYTPDASFVGTDSFTYTASDGHGGTSTATVTVTVTAPQGVEGLTEQPDTTATPPAATPAPVVTPDQVQAVGLPRTGVDIEPLSAAAEGLIGGGLSLSGVALLLTGRRRTRSSR